jgi:hypothetical protein
MYTKYLDKNGLHFRESMAGCFLAKIGLHYKQSKKKTIAGFTGKLKKGPPMLKGNGSTDIGLIQLHNTISWCPEEI